MRGESRAGKGVVARRGSPGRVLPLNFQLGIIMMITVIMIDGC